MPKNTSTARFSRTMSSSISRPTRAPIFDFGTVVDLIHHQPANSAKAVAFVWLDRQPKQRSIGGVGSERAYRDQIRHIETVVLKYHNRTGLSSVILAARNGPNFTALHIPPQSETASMKSWSSFA